MCDGIVATQQNLTDRKDNERYRKHFVSFKASYCGSYATRKLFRKTAAASIRVMRRLLASLPFRIAYVVRPAPSLVDAHLTQGNE